MKEKERDHALTRAVCRKGGLKRAQSFTKAYQTRAAKMPRCRSLSISELLGKFQTLYEALGVQDLEQEVNLVEEGEGAEEEGPEEDPLVEAPEPLDKRPMEAPQTPNRPKRKRVTN